MAVVVIDELAPKNDAFDFVLDEKYVRGGAKKTVSSATGTVELVDKLVHVTYTSTGAVTVTIDSDCAVDGNSFYIVDAGGNAGTNNITVATEGSETINGEVSGIIAADGESWEIYSDGTNFFLR